MDTEEFIEMSLEWNEENGWDMETYYKEHPERRMSFTSNEKHEEYMMVFGFLHQLTSVRMAS